MFDKNLTKNTARMSHEYHPGRNTEHFVGFNGNIIFGLIPKTGTDRDGR